MKNTITASTFFIIFLLLLSGTSSAQIDLTSLCSDDHIQLTGQICIANTHIAAPFLRITPDARHAGMGDVGISTNPDDNTLHFNSSKLGFAEHKYGFSANYTPLLRDLGVNDVHLFYFTNYLRLDDKQVIGFGVRYLDLGRVLISDTGSILRGGKIYEYETAVSYNRKLGGKLAVGLTAKYIYSQLPIGQSGTILMTADAQAIAGDLSLTYKTSLTNVLELTVGSALTNLGSKMVYVDEVKAAHLPTNFGIGSGIKWAINHEQSLHLALDINRFVQRLSSDFAENTYSVGAEYRYKRLAARIGHLNEHKTQGGIKTLTYGVGFNRKFASLNLSYLHTLNRYRHPLNKILRMSLALNFGEA